MSVTSDNVSKTRNRYPSAGSQYTSPARDYKSEAGYSNASKKSWTSSAARSSAYPRKGQTLGDIELTTEEQAHLESVLMRFDQFKQKEEGRIRSLRDELVEKQKVRIRNAEASGDGHCYNCGRLFMAVFNAPIECPICRHEFCRMCLEKTGRSKELICKFCRFESVSRGRLGVWFTEELKRARAAGRVRGVSGPEALRASLLRIKRESKASTLLRNLEIFAPNTFPEAQNIYAQGRANFGSAGSIVDDVSNASTQPMTESWVQQTAAQRDKHKVDSGSSQENLRAKSKISSSEASFPTSGHSALTGSSHLRPPPREQFSASVSDLRRYDGSTIHKQRLQSETDSKSTLSLASRKYGSTLSIYSERESSYTHGIAVTGDLRLDIQYDHQSSTLRIAVKQARDLAVADRKHMSCNPYVKSYLLPDKTKGSKRKTSHKKKNRNPVFEEVFKYSIPYSELLARTLQIAVWHKTSSGTNLFLGEVIIPFSDFQFEAGPQWYPLSERRTVNLPVTMQIDHGSLLLALKLIPGATSGNPCEIHVWIKSATGLTTSSSSSKSTTVNPYVKIYMLPDKAKISKRKTKVLKKTNNPEWNTNFVYNDINRNQLANIGIEVSVWDHGRVSSSDFLGGCRLNSGARTQPWMDATGTEQSIWLAMIQRPQTWLEGLIRLRSNLD
ncbi:hypothetical protein CRM22_004341 [Opisthorchis felineus]|uniref:Synaptotagmin-like protein 4 n=1 Tax=Opisthorchis felineus TaxID=147828 RepID=A0A4S2LWM8_OPIFE|nr:hypothetical protein CRM22_004341 [Opisthorchis felineus]